MQMQADISKAQERAFLSVEDILEIGIPSKTNKSYRAWSIGPIVKNSGQTAAQAIKMHFNYCVRQTPLLASSQLPDVTNEIKTAPPIGAQQTSNIGPSDVPLFQLLMQNKGRGYFYIWGWIRYDDIFQAHHEMRFCYSLKRIIGDFIHPLGVRGGFFFSDCPGTYACTDTQCSSPTKVDPAECPAVYIERSEAQKIFDAPTFEALEDAESPENQQQ